MKRKTLQEFVQEASIAHSNTYTYEKAVYVNTMTKLTVTCPYHGDFLISPNHHLRGSGCLKCSYIKRAKQATNSLQDFINKAKTIHENKYTYKDYVYKGRRHSSYITCPKHGNFLQCPDSHLNGSNCPICSKEKSIKNLTYTTEQFVKKATQIHKSTYTYENTLYKKSYKPVEITCKTHGSFKQIASDHIQGAGCPQCRVSGFDKAKPATLYYLWLPKHNVYKIGITNRNVNERFTAAELKNIQVVKTYKFKKGKDAYFIEQEILKHRKYLGYAGKPILLSGNTELFSFNVIELLNITVKQYTIKH